MDQSENTVFNKYNDVEYIGQLFSKHFHKTSWSPNFYISDIKKSGTYWDMYPQDEPVKKMNLFLRNSRLSPKLKSFVYYKAERANQDLVVSEILAYYFLKHKDEIHYQQKKIVEIGIQPLIVDGHKNPYDIEQELYLMKNKQPINIVYLKTELNQILYMDLCASQLDINAYTTEGMPYLLLTELQKNKLYVPKLNNSVRIIEIRELIKIFNETHYENYIKNLINTESNEDLEDDELDYLQGYHERIYKDFETLINKKID